MKPQFGRSYERMFGKATVKDAGATRAFGCPRCVRSDKEYARMCDSVGVGLVVRSYLHVEPLKARLKKWDQARRV